MTDLPKTDNPDLPKKARYDWNKAAMLLHIVSESGGRPTIDKLHRAALAELEEMCKDDEEEAKKKNVEYVEVVEDTASHVEDEKPREEKDRPRVDESSSVVKPEEVRKTEEATAAAEDEARRRRESLNERPNFQPNDPPRPRPPGVDPASASEPNPEVPRRL